MNIDTLNKIKSELSNFHDKQFRPGQEQAINFAIDSVRRAQVLCAPTGCHARGQKILMSTGELKKVQDIVIGDKLLSPDGSSRTVTKLYRGVGNMHIIIPVKGTPWVVNEDHILTLKRTNEGLTNRRTKRLNGDIKDVSVKDYLNWSNNQQHIYKLFRVPAQHFPWPKKLIIDPYFLGVLLGDGMMSHDSVGVSSIDKEIIEEVYKQAHKFNLKIRAKDDNKTFMFSSGVYDTKTVNGRFVKGRNALINALRQLDLFPSNSGNKFIPHRYKTASVENRKQLLAGLIDTDGSYQQTFDYISKSKQLANDVAFVARSLGLAAYVKECRKCSQNQTWGTYHRVSISGELNIVPCRLPRKQAGMRRQKKDVLVTGFRTQPFGVDNFYGFQITGDGRYLLDDFTVTHNSGKSLAGIVAGMAHDRFLYLCSSKQLQRQIEIDFPEVKVMWGRNNFQCNAHPEISAAECPFKGVSVKDGGSMQQTIRECKKQCAYELKKAEVLAHPYQVLNYTYFMYESNFVGKFSDYPIIICDEADTIESHVSNFIVLTISKHMLDRLRIKPPQYITSTSRKGLPAWKKWAAATVKKVQQHISITKSQINKTNPGGSLTRLNRELDSLNNMKFKLSVFEENMDNTWLFDEVKDFTGKVKAWEFKPTWLNQSLTEQFFFKHSKKFLLMSATFPPVQILAKQLGLNTGDIDYLEIESSFPKKNRSVHLMKTGDLSYKTFDRDLPKIIAKIKQILASHPNEKGIIHTVSWKLNKAVMEIDNPRLGTHTPKDKLEVIDRFMATSKPAVLVTPSSERGLDLPHDKCRFSIIAKMPYLSLADKLVKSRVYKSSMGSVWYSSDAAQKIVQACGRGVRSADDWCKMYILDKQACDRILGDQQLFPRYWMNACEMG